MNKYNRCPGATVVWVNEHSRRLLPALDQKRIAELVAAVAALLNRGAEGDCDEPFGAAKPHPGGKPDLDGFMLATTRSPDSKSEASAARGR
jgi:hypothetical protein